MPRGKRVKPEQIVNMLRQVEVELSKGSSIGEACRKLEIAPHTYYRYRKEYGGLEVDQAKKLKELERENSKLKRLVADLSLDNTMLKDLAAGKF